MEFVKILEMILAAFVGVLILVEGVLRFLFGLGNSLIYIPDQEIGYLLAPNQQVRRLGNQIMINQYSMRSHSIKEKRPDSTLRILLLGDSIANGAWWTDQNETISALIERQLRSNLISKSESLSFSTVEVLNASANSWGPRNQLAYLKRFGTFEAQIVVLLLNTDDLFATIPTSSPVGRDRNYPDHQPMLAITELFRRFFGRPQPVLGKAVAEKGDRVGFNLTAIAQIKDMTTNNNAQFILAITPLSRELEATGSRNYEQKARQRLEEFTITEQVPYIDFLSHFSEWQKPPSLYRDHIHLSPQGNQLVSQTITELLEKLSK